MPKLVFIAVLVLGACSTTPKGQPEESWMEYLKTLQTLEEAGPPLVEGSDEEHRAVERFQSLLSDFKAPDFSERILEVYAEEVFFNDTIKTLHRVEDLQEYLTATSEAIDKGTVDFLDVVADNGNYYFRWAMTIRFKRLARGEEKRSVGMTHVRFDAAGKVVLHQDFWDSVGGLFEHVPALGWVLRRAKKGL
ncbi:MAG: nuclear transport factor 2 family protein [Thermoanaerobaculia bacterium]